MRTYRLHFSENSDILQRRLKKALSTHSERILCAGFPFFPSAFKEQHPLITWAIEISESDKCQLSGWDEVHYLVKRPEQLDSIDYSDYSLLVIQPSSHKQKNRWIEAFKRIPESILVNKIFIEFPPWGAENCQVMTIQEIVSFLYELKFHFKDWRPGRRPGVNLWDWRVTGDFELEANNFDVKEFNTFKDIPKISVIVPTYNNKYFVSNVIRHLSAQTVMHSDYEVVLVDDGSSDKTFEYLLLNGIFKNIQLQYIYWPRATQRKRGDRLYRAGLSRNLGVRCCRSDQVVFLDSDMLVPDNFVSDTIEALKAYDVIQYPRYHINQQASSSTTNYYSVKDEETYIEEHEYWSHFFAAENWSNLEKYWKYTCTYGLAMSKKSFYQAGRFAHFYVSYGFEDTELGYRLSLLNKKFHLLPLKLLHLTSYSLSEYQFSKKNRQKLLERTAKLFFLNTLSIENFHHLEGFMHGEGTFFPRIKKYLYSASKNKSSHESV